jgi:hypothetical protein
MLLILLSHLYWWPGTLINFGGIVDRCLIVHWFTRILTKNLFDRFILDCCKDISRVSLPSYILSALFRPPCHPLSSRHGRLEFALMITSSQNSWHLFTERKNMNNQRFKEYNREQNVFRIDGLIVRRMDTIFGQSGGYMDNIRRLHISVNEWWS